MATSKDGHLYLLDPANLGGMGGHLQDLHVSDKGPILSTLSAFTSPSGVHVLVDTSGGAVTPAGAACGTGAGLLSFLITPGSPPVA